MKYKETAVVFGLSPTGLSAARSLDRNGVAVYGVDVLRYEIGHFSKSVKHDKRISYLPAGPELLAGLISFAKECPEKPVIFNANDYYIDFIAANRAELEPYFILTDSMRPESNSVFLNKRTFYEVCEKIGVAMPRTFFPESDEEALAAAGKIRYPAIVKPSMGFKLRKLLRGKKLVEVADAEELMNWWRVFKEWNADVVLQECIGGSEQNIAVAGLYMDKNRVCRSLFTAKKYRQYPPMYGSASYIESKWMEEVAALSEDLISKLGYHGVCGTEFKWDEADRCWKLIEINCRPTLWFAITRASGVDVVWDAYCDLRGRPNPVHRGGQTDGVRWQLFIRDMVSSVHFLRSRELSFGEFWRTAIDQRNKEWAICAWDDWGANFGYVVNTLAHIWTNFIKPPGDRA
ncbi:ATP-grasp domain-containing protein [bacterium]|nr:MAG: ATP-grasp domain-containing protein [bacterium]